MESAPWIIRLGRISTPACEFDRRDAQTHDALTDEFRIDWLEHAGRVKTLKGLSLRALSLLTLPDD
jgi:hypothetical protein